MPDGSDVAAGLQRAETVEPIYEELIRQAAQGEVLHNDDTTMRILGVTGETEAEAYTYGKSKRKGVFTSGIVSLAGGRRIALFYKTVYGAHVGDIFMSLIHTCRLCDVDPFDYLTQLHDHAAALPLNPARWTPWTYRATLDSPHTPTDHVP